MIETNYDYESGYHEGTIVEQDAKAFLGVYKRIGDVPQYKRLKNSEYSVDSDSAWESFIHENLSNTTQHTIDSVYGTAYKHWCDYCGRHNINPALADPEDIETWLENELEIHEGELQTTHDLRFRPLFRWYRWMAFNPDYSHQYQPTIMAVLLGGTVHDLWLIRLQDRKNNPLESNDE